MPRASHTVLLVEDNDDTTDAMQAVLETWGYHVVTARHGGEALNLLAGGLQPIAVVLDLVMPEADGWDFRRVQRANPRWERIPLMVVTGMSRDLDATTAQLGLPPDQCLAKPVDLDRLMAFLARAGEGASEQ